MGKTVIPTETTAQTALIASSQVGKFPDYKDLTSWLAKAVSSTSIEYLARQVTN